MNRKLRVGLNGLGRIGRHLFKICIDDPLIELIGINEINPDLNNWAYTVEISLTLNLLKPKKQLPITINFHRYI